MVGIVTVDWEIDSIIDRVSKMKIDRIYVSPLGRARATMEACLRKMDKEGIKYPEPVTFDWLREFPTLINRPDKTDKKSICWDWMPDDWTAVDEFYDFENWMDHPVLKKQMWRMKSVRYIRDSRIC